MTTPSPDSTPAAAGPDEPALARRRLLRGGALVAGAAGLLVGASATPAHAADDDPLLAGNANEADSTTGLRIGGADGGPQPVLSLTNANGPALAMDPLPATWDGSLEIGQIANTTRGPVIGIDRDGAAFKTPLLTEQDVWLPFVLDTPMRLIDTRTAEGRTRVTRPSPLARDGKLPAGRSLSFWIAPVQPEFAIPAVHLNLTVVLPTTNGYATVYPGPTRPPTSTVNFRTGITIANGSMVGTSTGTYSVLFEPDGSPTSLEVSVINVHTTAAAWIVVDATAAYAVGRIPPTNQSRSRARVGRTGSPTALARRAFGRLR